MAEKLTLVEGAGEADRLVRKAYAGRKGVQTNCFMFAAKLNGYADSGRLFYEETEDGLLLLCDMDEYYILYYHLSPASGLSFEKKDKPAIVEFFDSEHRPNRQNRIMVPYFEKAGFAHHNTIRRMSCEYDEKTIEALMGQHADQYEVITAGPAHYETILTMLYGTFDPVKNLFPARADMRAALANGEFLCILDGAGKVVCTVQVVYEKASFYMLYVVTDPDWRGKNLSWQIRKAATKRAWDMGIRKRMGWVLEGNTPGIVTAQKTGLDFDGHFTLHYVK